jgi:hypothetical protein
MDMFKMHFGFSQDKLERTSSTKINTKFNEQHKLDNLQQKSVNMIYKNQ